MKETLQDDASEGTMSQTASSRNSIAFAKSENGAAGDEQGEGDDQQAKEATANSVANKFDPSQMTDAQKELNVLSEQGKKNNTLHYLPKL